MQADLDKTLPSHPVGPSNGHGVVGFSKFPGVGVKISIESCNGEINFSRSS